MGKCSKCGKKIEYNNYKVISSLVYCPNCTLEETIDLEAMKVEAEKTEQFLKDREECTEIDPESLKAEKEAEEQFEKDMSGHGQEARTLNNEPVNKELQKMVDKTTKKFLEEEALKENKNMEERKEIVHEKKPRKRSKK